jgi:hypothetical protein
MTEAQFTARRNSRHGLTGQIVVHTPEDEQAFKKYCDGIREALDPVDALELDLAQAIAEDRWRLNRARALENSMFALGQSAHLPPDGSYSELDAALAQARMDHAHQLHLLTIYENRIRRSVEKNTAEFRVLQAERKAAVEAQEWRLLTVPFVDGDHDPADDPPGAPDSSVRFFQGRHPASDGPEPAPLPEPATPSRQEVPQRTTGRPGARQPAATQSPPQAGGTGSRFNWAARYMSLRFLQVRNPPERERPPIIAAPNGMFGARYSHQAATGCSLGRERFTEGPILRTDHRLRQSLWSRSAKFLTPPTAAV